jgi:hypothetical protein
VLAVVAARGGYASVLTALPVLTLLALLVFTFGWHEYARPAASTSGPSGV